MIPPAIAATIRKALKASLSLATSEHFADLPNAQRHAAEIRVALEWVEQECLTVLNTTEDRVEYDGPVVHEGQRWPPFGANGHRGVTG